MSRTLIVTNDFPPRPGGIQAFVHELALRQEPDSLAVFASAHAGDDVFDAAQPFPIFRWPRYPMIPTPAVTARAVELVRKLNIDTAWFGAMAPLGAMAPKLRAAGVRRCVAQTHGHEVGWAALPGARAALRRIGRSIDVVTYLGEYTRSRLDPVLGGVTTLERLAPGVDIERYHPGVSGARVREKYGLGDRPVVVCVSRLVPRKGQDRLISALPLIRQKVPDAALLIVGGGRYERRLRALARRLDVVFTGAVPWDELPEHYAAGDVFAMPCRTRRGGLDVEGLGIVYLEASALGLPVVAGDSGGAPDAVRENETGFVVPGSDVDAIADKVCTLLTDRSLALRMGAQGRAWVEQEWTWELIGARMSKLLRG
ncbi:MAG: glycosyltransferase family 4 protein [Corynebacteriales bacterium]|nr:glycosyltransferase family 4 protein [Mycobacteriales bacterium]